MGVGVGQGGQGLAVGPPEACRGPGGGRQGQQGCQQAGLDLPGVHARGHGQTTQVRPQGGVGRHPPTHPLHVQPQERLQGLTRTGAPRQGARQAPHLPGTHRPRQGELQEHLTVTLLVHHQAVHPLGLPRQGEQPRRAHPVPHPQEHPRPLLQERRQEVRRAPTQHTSHLLHHTHRPTRTRTSQRRHPPQIPHQTQRQTRTLRVVHHHPPRKPHHPPTTKPHTHTTHTHQTHHTTQRILHTNQRLRHQPHHMTTTQHTTRIRTSYKTHTTTSTTQSHTTTPNNHRITNHFSTSTLRPA